MQFGVLWVLYRCAYHTIYEKDYSIHDWTQNHHPRARWWGWL